jgi:hypothetical protein
MRIATPRHSPGIQSPPGAMIAVGVVAVMGLYGFTTALQKSIAVQRSNLTAVRADDGEVRLASAVGRTPTLVYALTEGGAAPAPTVVARPAPAKPPEPQIGEPPELKLASVAPAPIPNSPSEVAVPAAAPSAIASVDASDVNGQGAAATTREPAPPAALQ